MMPKLDLLQLDLTDECPLYCAHCSNSSGPKFTSSLSYETAGRLLKDAAALGCRMIVLSGGEPLRYPNLAQSIALCRDLGMRTAIFTTGIRDKKTRLPITAAEWRDLVSLSLNRAVFSVYASPSNRAFHNRVVRLRPTGTSDAFEVNEEGILRAKGAGVDVELQFIPSEETCSELRAISAWAAKLRVDRLHLQFPTMQGRNRENASLVVSPDGESLLKREAIALWRTSKPRLHISRLWRSRWGWANQMGGPNQLIVRSDGRATICNACKYGRGADATNNIYEKSLGQIWGNIRWHGFPCECESETESLRQGSASSRRSGLSVVRTNELLTSSVE